MRILYTVPLVHGVHELMFEARDDFAKLPKERTRPYLRLVDSYWDTIEKRIRGYDIQRVYMDGYSGEPWDAFVQNAYEGSRVSRTVVDLISKGATLEITEELPLVSKVHETYARIKSKPYFTMRDIDNQMISLILCRDLFISRNIRASLSENERGILFLGLAHNILNFKDVQLVGIYSKKKLAKKLSRIGTVGEITLRMMDTTQQILKKAEKLGILEKLEDYVDNPEKYGYDYSV